MTNNRKEPFGGVMIVILKVMFFTIGYVNWICQSFLSGCVFFLLSLSIFVLFSTMVSDLLIVAFHLSLSGSERSVLLRK